MRKKILHLTNSSVKSNFLLSIAKLYDKKKYELFIGTLEEKGELHTELEKLNIPCISFNLKDERLGFFKILPIIRYLKRNKIDILHVHTFWTSLYACIAAKLIHTKVVLTRHHADHHIRANKTIHVKIDAFTAKMVDKVIAVSNFTKSLMRNVEKVPENHIEVIYNGLEELPSRQLNHKSFLEHLNICSSDNILLCISRLHPEKNIETIIHAIKTLDRNDVHLLVAGSGLNTNYHALLTKTIKESSLESNVHFLGFRNDIKELMGISTLLIHSALSESFGFVITEAMQQKTPIIASEIPALIEVATSDAAFFFPPKDKNKLTYLIKHVLSLQGTITLSKRLDFGHKRYKENFTFEQMIKKYEKVYDSI